MGQLENLQRQHQTLKKVHMSTNVRNETLEIENQTLRKENTDLRDKISLINEQNKAHTDLMNRELQASEARVAEQKDSRMKLAAELKALKEE